MYGMIYTYIYHDLASNIYCKQMKVDNTIHWVDLGLGIGPIL